jgi:hypothetical protein
MTTIKLNSGFRNLLLIIGVLFGKIMLSQGVPTMDVQADLQLAKINMNLGAQQKLQMQAITKYVEQIQKTKQQIHAVKETMKQAKQTADIMTAIMNENYTVDGITDLNINKNFKDVLEDVLCINFKDYVPNNSTMLKIHVNFMSGIGNCNNMQVYANTYSGMNFKSKANQYGQIVGNLSYQDYTKQIKRINKDSKDAQAYQDYTNNLNDRTKLEVGYKMLAVADEMIKSAEELQKILNVGKSEIEQTSVDKYKDKSQGTQQINSLFDKLTQLTGIGEGLAGGGSSGTEDLGAGFESGYTKSQKENENSKGIDMTRAQRIELILKSHDYLQKGLEYKQRAIELIQECSNSPTARAKMKKHKRNLDRAQLNSLLYSNSKNN